MSSDIVRQLTDQLAASSPYPSNLSRSAAREYTRRSERQYIESTLAEQAVDDIARVTERALTRGWQTHVVKRMVEMQAPDFAETATLYTVAAAVETSKVIGNLHRGR